MAGPALDLGLEGGRWQLYRDPPRQPPVGVTVGGNGGHALIKLPFKVPIIFSTAVESSLKVLYSTWREQ